MTEDVLDDVLERFNNYFKGLRSKLHLLTIIPLVESIVRIWYHLNPRVYSERLRIRGVYEGTQPKKGDKFVLFVLAAAPPQPTFTQNAIDAVNRSPLNLVIVFNGELSADNREILLSQCHLLIERVNLGRDFGGYRDGFSVLRSRYPTIQRLIFLNDSVFFLEKGLDRLFADLDGPHDFIGLTEVIEHHYHVQSFMVSFSERVLKNKRFLRYWQRYRPISSRRWSIYKGEVGLTRRVTRSGFKPYVLYHGSQLISHLRSRSTAEILDAVHLLPSMLRATMDKEFNKMRASVVTSPLSTVESVSRAVTSLSVNVKVDPALSQLREANIDKIVRISGEANSMERRTLENFAGRIVSTITKRNQMHVGGFLFMKYLGMPVFKRDVFYREVYALEDVYEFLSEIKEPLRDEVIADLRQKDTAVNLKGLSRILYRHGSI